VRRAALASSVLAIGLGAVALAGCGSSAPGITEDASRQLELQVAAVRNAAASVDREGAERALADLRRSVEDLRARDEISAGRRSEVLDAAAAVEAQLLSIPTTTTTTTTTTTLPPPTRDEDDEDNDNRRDRNRGGNGGDGGGGGDGGDGGGGGD
jgi:HAMP domain-containing protein